VLKMFICASRRGCMAFSFVQQDRSRKQGTSSRRLWGGMGSPRCQLDNVGRLLFTSCLNGCDTHGPTVQKKSFPIHRRLSCGRWLSSTFATWLLRHRRVHPSRALLEFCVVQPGRQKTHPQKILRLVFWNRRRDPTLAEIVEEAGQSVAHLSQALVAQTILGQAS